MNELEKQISNSVGTVEKISFAKAISATNIKTRSLFACFPVNVFKTNLAEQEYRILVDFKWTDHFQVPLFDVNPIDFWKVVYENPRFKNLGFKDEGAEQNDNFNHECIVDDKDHVFTQ